MREVLKYCGNDCLIEARLFILQLSDTPLHLRSLSVDCPPPYVGFKKIEKKERGKKVDSFVNIPPLPICSSNSSGFVIASHSLVGRLEGDCLEEGDGVTECIEETRREGEMEFDSFDKVTPEEKKFPNGDRNVLVGKIEELNPELQDAHFHFLSADSFNVVDNHRALSCRNTSLPPSSSRLTSSVSSTSVISPSNSTLYVASSSAKFSDFKAPMKDNTTQSELENRVAIKRERKGNEGYVEQSFFLSVVEALLLWISPDTKRFLSSGKKNLLF